MSALFELITISSTKGDLVYTEGFNIYPRSNVFRCHCCGYIVCNNYVPDYIPNIVCLRCCISIRKKYKDIILSLCYKRNRWQNIFPQIHNEIKEIGLQPNRILQSQFHDPSCWSIT